MNFCNLHYKFDTLNFGQNLNQISSSTSTSNNFVKTKCEFTENSLNQNFSLTEDMNEMKNLSTNNSFQNLEKIFNNSFSYLVNDNNKNPNSISNISNSSSCIDKYKKDPNNKKKNFPCFYPSCKKIYKTKENLQLHYQNIHLKEKPYSCCYCDKTFSHRTGKINNN